MNDYNLKQHYNSFVFNRVVESFETTTRVESIQNNTEKGNP